MFLNDLRGFEEMTEDSLEVVGWVGKRWRGTVWQQSAKEQKGTLARHSPLQDSSGTSSKDTLVELVGRFSRTLLWTICNTLVDSCGTLL